METLKRIDFDSEIELYSLSDFENKILNKNGESYINLNEVELANVISVISLHQMSSHLLVGDKAQTFILNTLVSGEYDFLNNNREYVIKLIPELDQCYKDDFADLLRNRYLRSDIFENKDLNIFSSEAITDTIQFERLSEFGLYNIHKMCVEVFKDINNNERNEFINQGIPYDGLAKAIVGGLERAGTDLSEPEIQSMIMMLKYEFYGKRYGIKDALREGNVVFNLNFFYKEVSKNIQSEIKPLIQAIIMNERDNNLNRDQGWTR